MPTINTSIIEGYEAMTSEQKLEALLKLEVPAEVDMSQFVPKATADKYSSEVAALKKQLREKQTDEENEKADRDAKWAEMEEKLAKLEREKLEAAYKASYLALPGYDDALADETAKAMADGNMGKVFENSKKAAENAEKKLKADLMGQFPPPPGAGEDGGAESAGVALAKELGKAKAESLKMSNDIMNYYK